ncbi:hypothetical protein [uncultured Celeribacter sp.]|uniref:hypothetical protein n=1 Tax=uncultured Celeribacter sp. TaxID=1303376 RepID=UPI002AA95C95|nr:hypothetical protein [uncultured Celeribacter sp.]
MWGATPFDQLMCRVIFKGYRYEGLYTAPDTDYSLSLLGSIGGMNWGGLSYDRTANTIFINDMRLGLWVHMMEQDPDAAASNGSEAVNTVKSGVPLKGTPISYVSQRDGRQDIVISAGGARQSSDRGDHLLAYALPQS